MQLPRVEDIGIQAEELHRQTWEVWASRFSYNRDFTLAPVHSMFR